jgi:hypothetical protein
MNRKALLIVVASAVATFLSACSSSKPITVAITPAPPSTLEINNSATIGATVTNDSSNSGVSWSCSPSPCGTFTPATTLSGATTVYTASSTPGSVTITATSVKKTTVTATASVTISPVASASTITGQYAFSVNGFDAVGDYYAAVGSVTLDGNGNVTLGEEDLNNSSYAAAVVGDALTGTYTVGNDGQGSMTVTATTGTPPLPDPLVGVAGVQTLNFTVVNANHLLITEFDTAATSGGTMDFQTGSAITAGIAGNFAMTLGGLFGGAPTSLGAVYTATAGSPGTLLGTATADQDLGGTVTIGLNLNGTYGAPDSNGRGTLTIGSANFTYYIVGSEAFYVVETDMGSVLVGASYGQGTGTFSAASISSTNAMDEPFNGQSVNGPVVLAGQFTSDGMSTFTGVADYNDAGTVSPAPPDTLTTIYAIATTGYGSMTATVLNDSDFVTYGIYATDPALNINDPNNSSGGGGALIAQLDPNALGIGFIVPQSATALTAVNEANSFAGQIAPSEYVNSTGQLVFTTTSFAGTSSINDFNLSVTPPVYTQTTAEAVSGAITADTTNVGRYTVVATIGAATNNRVSYVASGGFSFDIDVDSSATLTEAGSGFTEGQQ